MLESRALRGAVAQLGERRVRNAKVEGSIPFRSTNPLFLDDPTLSRGTGWGYGQFGTWPID